MSSKSKKARRRKRMRKWLKRSSAMKPLNNMHQALGEFLTEMGRVEFRMMLFAEFLNDAPIEALFADFTGETFGRKIVIFKGWCDLGGVPEDQKAALQKVYEDLEDLRIKRNFIVHGETWEGAFDGNPRQPYRVGLVEGNLEYLDEFERAEHGDNVFNAHQVRAATRLCTQIINSLAAIRESFPVSEEPYEEPDNSEWPPPKA